MAISVSSPLLLLSYYKLPRTGQTCKWSICPINQLQCLEKSSIIILQMFYPTFLTHSQLRTPTLKTFHSFNVCCLRMEKLEISKVILNNFSRTPPLVRPFCILTKFLYTRTKWLWSQRDVMHRHYIIPLTQVVWSLHSYSDLSRQSVRESKKPDPSNLFAECGWYLSLRSRTYTGIPTNHKVLPVVVWTKAIVSVSIFVVCWHCVWFNLRLGKY